jgi:lipopolysaccharide export system permease protein
MDAMQGVLGNGFEVKVHNAGLSLLIMIFQSALRQELARQFLATTIVLVTIVLTVMLIRTLGQASRGQIAAAEVGLVLGFSLLANVPVLLVMSLFIASVSTLSRHYADSEMVIWFSSGQSLSTFLKPLLMFALPYLLLCMVMMLFVWPWCNQQVSEIKQRFEQRGDLQRVSPGEFQESSNGKRVFFVDKGSSQNQGQQVFISTLENGRQTFTTAQSGVLNLVGEDRVLSLNQGQRLDIDQQSKEFRLSEFRQYDVVVGQSSVNFETRQPNAIPSLELIQQRTPKHLGELSWRLGLFFTGLNLMLLSLLLTGGSQRRNRNTPLVLSLLAFIAYFNFLNLGQAWIAVERLSILHWMLLFHGGSFAVLFMLLWAKNRQWRLIPPLKRSLEASA